jgi:hypothetical protein
MGMIEDPGAVVVVCLFALVVLCFYFAYKQYREPNIWLAGHLYLMYYWGDHDAIAIMNAIDPTEYTVTAVYHDLLDLERRGYVARAPEHDNVGEGRYGHAYSMTDTGEAKYHKLATLYGLPHEPSVGTIIAEPEDPREAYQCERDVF